MQIPNENPNIETLSDTNKEQVEQILADILLAYDEQHETKDVKQFCVDYLQEKQTYEDINTALMVVVDTQETLEQIESYHRDLEKSQQKGKSRINWFKNTIKELVNIEKGKKRNEIVAEVKDALTITSDQLSYDVTHEDVSLSTPLEDSSLDNGIHETVVATNLLGDIQNITALSTLVLAPQFENQSNKQYKQGNIVTKAFEDELNSQTEKDLKTVLSIGTIIAKDQGLIEPLNTVDNIGIVSAIDMGITFVKTASKVASGKISPLKALDYLYNRATAIVSTAVRWKANVIGWAAGTELGAIIGTTFGPVGIAVGAIAGGVAGKIAGSKIGEQISKGVKTIANTLKTAVKKAWKGAKKVGNKIKNSKLNPLNWFP
ncbi:MAG: hypothetical protein QNJ47_01210 [Nostocaceae cyanobacterium]|nr:hypothetical protein [Nostocaceae cyanobacterium]